MKKHLLLFSLILITGGLSVVFAQVDCPAGRYQNKIFSTSTSTVTYGSGIRYNGQSQNLMMDIYQPKGDNFAHRPLIILAFGGSFTSGVRQSPDLLVLCDEFAKRGYVTASIDYRIGKENGDDTAMVKAVIRGLQDMSAALRYFMKDARTDNKYHIDTNQIFIGGTSAGGFIGLNHTFFSLLSSRPAPEGMQDILVNMGGIWGGNTGSPGHNITKPVKGVINLCGAIMDTLWIQPNSPMIFAVHGTKDETVPYYYDSIKGITDIKSRFFGSGDIETRCTNIGLNHFVYPFQDADHVPFVLPSTPYLPPSKPYMDTTVALLRDFLFANVVCDPTIISGINDAGYELPITIGPNPTDGLFDITSRYENILTAEVYSTDGKLVARRQLEPLNTTRFLKEELGSGMFMIHLTDKNNPQVKRLEKVVIY